MYWRVLLGIWDSPNLGVPKSTLQTHRKQIMEHESGQIIVTSHGSLGPQKVAFSSGKSPRIFRKIDRLVKYYEPFGQMNELQPTQANPNWIS